jgi:hypothetical protein
MRRCLRLRGGSVDDGVKWIYKTCRELSGLLGCCMKTVERDLRLLVELGWLKREKHDARWGKQGYYYCLGDAAPLSKMMPLSSCGIRPTASCAPASWAIPTGL